MQRTLAAFAPVPRTAPLAWAAMGLVAAFGIVSHWIGLRLTPPSFVAFAPMALAFLFASWARTRGGERAGEAAFTIGLWFGWSNAGMQASYVVALIGAPLQDGIFARADAALGLDWDALAAAIHARPGLNFVLDCVYGSVLAQLLASSILLAVFSPGKGNRELFVQASIALALTLSIFAAVPALGPAARFGWQVGWSQVLLDLRAGHAGPLPYAGVVEFPSFHTAMALLLAYAHRRSLWCLLPFAGLNCIMLASIPVSGDHYFVDMLGGAAVAAAAIAVAGRLFPSARNC